MPRKLVWTVSAETQERLFRIAMKYPDSEGRLYHDEIIINALIYGLKPGDLIERFPKFKSYRPLYRRAPNGNTLIFVCPVCGTVLHSKKKAKPHIELCRNNEDEAMKIKQDLDSYRNEWGL